MDFKLKENNAPLWKRILAYLIDTFIIYFVVLYPFRPYYDKLNNLITTENLLNTELINQIMIIAPKFFLVSLIVALLTILYWVLLEYYAKQSIGKMLFKIKVVSKKGTLKFWQCFVRNISKCSSLVLIIDFIFVFFNKDNQRLFERISNTKVIERKLEI